MIQYYRFSFFFLLAAVGLFCESCRTVERGKALTSSTDVRVKGVSRDSVSLVQLASLARTDNHRIRITLRDITVSRDSSGNEHEGINELVIESEKVATTDSTSIVKADEQAEQANDSSNVSTTQERRIKKKAPLDRIVAAFVIMAIIAAAIYYYRYCRFKHS